MRINRSFTEISLVILIGGFFSIIVLIIFIDTWGLLNLYKLPLPMKPEVISQLAGGFGSIIITVALVLLYQEQKNIQQNQEEWAEADHTPNISVEEWDVRRGNTVSFKLNNTGNGIAENLSVIFEVEYISSGSISDVKIDWPVNGEGNLVHLDSNSRTIQDKQLDPKAFESIPEFKYRWTQGGMFGSIRSQYNEEEGDFRDVSEFLVDNGVSDIEFTVVLVYDFVKRYSEKQIEVWGGSISLEETVDLESLVIKATELDDYGQGIPPEVRKEWKEENDENQGETQ